MSEQKNNTVKKETLHIAAGVIAGDAVMCLVFFFLNKFDYTVPVGALVGSCFAVGIFYYLGRSIEKALSMGEGGQAYLKKTYALRMLLHALCIVLAVLLPFENIITGIVPLFLPRITIYVMQLLGMYKPANNK